MVKRGLGADSAGLSVLRVSEFLPGVGGFEGDESLDEPDDDDEENDDNDEEVLLED